MSVYIPEHTRPGIRVTPLDMSWQVLCLQHQFTFLEVDKKHQTTDSFQYLEEH